MKGFTVLVYRAEARFDESMDPRLFDEWLQIDDHLRRAIGARDAGRLAPMVADNKGPASSSHPENLTLIVSGADVRTYACVKQALASRKVDVILDRRMGDRRRVARPTIPDRRNADRRKRRETRSVKAYSQSVGSASR
jgi:hypothetical protein